MPSDYEQQLRMGRKVEAEHKPTVDKIREHIQCNITLTDEDIFELIARDHLKELDDYYTRLEAMEAGTLPTSKECPGIFEVDDVSVGYGVNTAFYVAYTEEEALEEDWRRSARPKREEPFTPEILAKWKKKNQVRRVVENVCELKPGDWVGGASYFE